jgi:hypothetical protein
MVFRFAAPRERERFDATTVRDPFAGAGRFGFVREEAARELDVNALARELNDSSRDSRRSGRQRDCFFAGVRVNGESDVELEDRTAGMREERRELAVDFARGAGDEGNEFAIETRFADQEAVGNGDADPAVFEDIHCETGAAGRKVVRDVEVVIDARERGVHWRRFRTALVGKRFVAEVAVFIDGDDHPARRMRRVLR